METKTSSRAAAEEALLDAAERLLVDVGYARITTRRVAEEAGVNHGLVHYYFGSNENLMVQALERFTERLIARQRELYAADMPFVEKWRTAMRYLVSEDVTYEKVWLELQALGWNNPDVRERLARVNAEWRAVLTEAFEEPHRRARDRHPTRGARLARDHVQRRDHGRAPRRNRDGARPSSSSGSTDGCRADRASARADAGALPGRVRLRRARRSARLLRGLRLRRADRPVVANLVAHSFAALEDADPLPRAALSGRGLRRAGQRPLRPARRMRRPTASASSRPTPSRCWTRPRPSAP